MKASPDTGIEKSRSVWKKMVSYSLAVGFVASWRDSTWYPFIRKQPSNRILKGRTKLPFQTA
ncbi:hypothetical protein BBG10_10045 [Streptococcus dysgalactiae subsp. equisimilis]|nr:hypothetical protein BBG10_10045 [Streptococcus dysgalactiae subsp. equisimilis]